MLELVVIARLEQELSGAVLKLGGLRLVGVLIMFILWGVGEVLRQKLSSCHFVNNSRHVGGFATDEIRTRSVRGTRLSALVTARP